MQPRRSTIVSPLRLCVLLTVIHPGFTTAQEVPSDDIHAAAIVDIYGGRGAASISDEVIEEIIVVAPRPLPRIEAEIREADVEMYTIFNVLNDDKLYDVHCNWEGRAGSQMGSRLKEQVCKPQYERGIEVNQFDGIGDNINIDNSINIPRGEIRKRRTLLQEKIIRLAEENPELEEAIYKRASLQRELDRSRRRTSE